MTADVPVTRDTGKPQALWYTEPGRCGLETVSLNEMQTGEVLVETLFSGISRGTEGLVFRGDVPSSEWQRMRAPHQEGISRFRLNTDTQTSAGSLQETRISTAVLYFLSSLIKASLRSPPCRACRFPRAFPPKEPSWRPTWKRHLMRYGTENHHRGITSAWSAVVSSVS